MMYTAPRVLNVVWHFANEKRKSVAHDDRARPEERKKLPSAMEKIGAILKPTVCGKAAPLMFFLAEILGIDQHATNFHIRNEGNNLKAQSPAEENMHSKVEVEQLKNPGMYEDVNKNTKDLENHCFEGLKFQYNMPHCLALTTSHSIHLANHMPFGYRFGAVLTGVNRFGMKDFPVIYGEIDGSGHFQARMIHQLHDRWRLKIAAKHISGCGAGQIMLNYKGPTHSASISSMHSNWHLQNGLYAINFLQSITPQLALGTEVTCKMDSCGNESLVGVAGRYTVGDVIWSWTASPMQALFCYYLQCSKQLQVGAQFQWTRGNIVNSTLMYQIKLPNADFIYRGSIDSNLIVTAMLLKKMDPWEVHVSARLDHLKRELKLGFEIAMGV